MKMMIYIFCFVLLVTSCNSFLEYKDKDKIIPSELEHYSELIYGEILTKSGEDLGRPLELMTDDVDNMVPVPNSSKDDKREPKYYGWFTWAKETQIDAKGNETFDEAWGHLYHRILMCNIIESEVNVFEEDIDGVKWRLIGEVQCMRAICYYYLCGMYGAPYRDPQTAKTAMGVPVNKEVGIYDKIYERSTLQEVYDLMEKDLKSSIVNFEKGKLKNTIFRPNSNVARLFLSRIYLAEKRYTDVVSVCNDALSSTTGTIMPKANLEKCSEYGTPLFEKTNPSIFFTWMDRWSWSNFFATYSARYLASGDLKSLYQENTNDIRLQKFFGYYFTPVKENSKTNTYKFCYRVEEFYFNRAEAYMESGSYDLGLNDVNMVRKERIKGDNYKLVAKNQEEAIQVFRKEKRREFCFEDMRWYDMKRWGVEVTHKFYDFNNANAFEKFVLKADSPNYMLPLPLDIQRRNGKIEKPTRVDTKVLND